jgi:hypothetical protein
VLHLDGFETRPYKSNRKGCPYIWLKRSTIFLYIMATLTVFASGHATLSYPKVIIALCLRFSIAKFAVLP